MTSEATGPRGENPLTGDEELTSLVHDVRHCLYALRIGLGLMKTKCQEKQLCELCDTMAEEEQNAARLFEELLIAVRERFERSSN